ncbi:hypothetical protein SGRA_1860 [Saprospira grandis str. Lewin]|uniref:Uncharacterized protein n=1 Tax=Saprospira grandis (strain Lewin) TaxID=984262 RepID=H6L0Q8_SAPGL|nr:hypothetical protein SGRA_1860 [Saprospira grandis str. Lewin]
MSWGCPSLRSGRAVSQLAVRSALQRFQRFGLPPSAALLSIPQPAALRACRDQNRPLV